MGFLVAVFNYASSKLATTHPRSGSTLQDYATYAIIAFVVLDLFPWKNEVTFVCYQLSGFLSFVTELELLQLMHSPAGLKLSSKKLSWLVICGFIVAFACEAVSAITVGSLAFGWVLAEIKPPRPRWRGQAGTLTALVLALNVYALGLVFAFAQRSAATKKYSIVGEVVAVVLHRPYPVSTFALYTRILLGAIAAALLLVLVAWIAGRRVLRQPTTAPAATGPDAAPGAVPSLLLIPACVLPSLAVAAMSSLQTGNDDFSSEVYPWAAFLLTAKLVSLAVIMLRVHSAFDMGDRCRRRWRCAARVSCPMPRRA